MFPVASIDQNAHLGLLWAEASCCLLLYYLCVLISLACAVIAVGCRSEGDLPEDVMTLDFLVILNLRDNGLTGEWELIDCRRRRSRSRAPPHSTIHTQTNELVHFTWSVSRGVLLAYGSSPYLGHSACVLREI